MRAGWLGQSLDIVAGTLLVLAVTQGAAEARSKHTAQYSRHSAATNVGFNRAYRTYASHSWRPSWHRSALQCVPFARENSGIELSGNAGTWWNNASGLYERGARPEVGSILNFRATGHMRMGHVAVVTNVLTSRHIEIDHANWGAPGRISRNIDVVDVSPSNDWTEVRVALSQAEDYGSTYPTYGFIYDRPDHGTMVANNAPIPASSDLRLASERSTVSSADAAPEEVAEAAGDDDGVAPRYSSRHRRGGRGRGYPMHAAAAWGHHHGYSPAATTYRVSTRGVAVSKSHRSTRNHF
jgi:surface antigen